MADEKLDMSQYLGVFLDEAAENLALLEQNILCLEKHGGPERPETLQEMFRSAHTLKGSSRAMGFTKFGDLTHRMEDVLDRLRKDELQVSGELTDVLLQCLDALNSMKADIESGGDGAADTFQLLENLDHFLCKQPPLSETPESDAGTSTPVTLASALSESEKTQIDRAREDGTELWLLRVTLVDDCLMKSVRAMMVQTALEDIATIVRLFPCEEEIERESFGSQFAILAASGASRDDLEAAASGVSEIASACAVLWEDAQDEGLHAGRPSEGQADQGPFRKPAKADASTGDGPAPAKARKGQTIRVDVDVLDNLLNLAGELVIDKTRVAQLASSLAAQHPPDALSKSFEETAAHLGRTSGDLQDEIMQARMLPVENVFNRFPRMVRDLAQKAGKEIDFRVEGEETELDRSVIEVISDPLIHLLRNSIDHGIEPPDAREAAGKPRKGTVRIAASHLENHIVIVVSDDGRGIDPDKVKEKAVARNIVSAQEAEGMSDKAAFNLIFAAGLSTAEEVTDVSGRGVGMDIVKSNIQQVGGQVSISSRPGEGTDVTVRLPLTLAIIQALLVRAAGDTFAIPLPSVNETIHLDPDKLHSINKRQAILHRGSTLPLVVLEEALFGQLSGVRDPRDRGKKAIVIAAVEGHSIGLVVDRLIGEQEIVIKSLGEFLGRIEGVSGATILGDGSVALIVDVPGLVAEVIGPMDGEAAPAA